jgi:hypothetical protein
MSGSEPPNLTLEILKAINILGPAVVELILISRDPPTGKISVTAITEATDEQAKTNITQLKEFFALADDQS